MKKYISSCPDNPPEWYWVGGLHDASIVEADMLEFPRDYYRFVGEKNKHNQNLLVLKINAKGALCNNKIKEIRLFNYRILTDGISLLNREKMWWLADRLTYHNGYYNLEIDLQDFDSDPEEFTFKIQFESAEVKGE